MIMTPLPLAQRNDVEDADGKKGPEGHRYGAAKGSLPGTEYTLHIVEVEDVEGKRVQHKGGNGSDGIVEKGLPPETHPESDGRDDGQRDGNDVAEKQEPAVPGKPQRHLHVGLWLLPALSFRRGGFQGVQAAAYLDPARRKVSLDRRAVGNPGLVVQIFFHVLSPSLPVTGSCK